MRENQYLQIEIFHAVEYNWPRWTLPYIAWPRQYALWIIEEGALQVTIGERKWTLERNDVFLAPMRQPRYLGAPQREGVRWWSLNFIPSWFGRIDPLQSLLQPLRLTNPANLAELRGYMQLLSERWMTPWRKGPLTPMVADEYRSLLPVFKAHFSQAEHIIHQGLAQAIFGWCLEALQENDIPLHLHQSLPEWLVKALAIIEETPQAKVEQIAAEVACSPAQLRRLFHQWLGASPQEYIILRRMDRAYHLLESTDWTVQSIANSLGFASAPSFARIFRKYYAVAPQELRNALRTKSANQ